MSASDLYPRWLEAVNRRDAAAVAALYAPNAVVHDPAYGEPLEGKDAVHRDLVSFFQAFPDLEFELGATLQDGNTVAGEGRFRGTHRGVLVTEQRDVPPTGRRVELGAASFWRLDGQGRILEDRRYFDLAGILSQLGVSV
jgi:steroid delta-isomerase-like uncharacterized protein